MGKYLTILQIYLKDTLFHRSKLLAQLIMLIFRISVIFALYSYAFRYVNKDINNINFQIATWSMGLYFIALSLNLRHTALTIKDDIQSGEVEVMLNKPYNYLGFKVFRQIAIGIPNIITTAPAVLIILLLFIGKPVLDYNLEWYAYTLGVFFLGITVALISYCIVGVTSFWIQDSEAVYWLYDKATMVLGGAYIPVALFPDLVRHISEYSPMGASMFISHAAYQDFNSYAPRLIATQAIWIIILLIILSIVFNFARKKVDINGG